MKRQVLFQFGAYTLNPSKMSLRRGDELVRLPPKAFDLLAILVEGLGDLVTKQHLLDAVWPGTFIEESNLTQNVFLLRKKLGQAPDGSEYIETLPKRGYRMRVTVHEVELPGEDPLASAKTQPEVRVPEPDAKGASSKTYHRGVLTGASVIAGLGLAVLLVPLIHRGSENAPVAHDFVQITHDTSDKRGRTGTFGGPDAALLTDGSRLYFTSMTSAGPGLWQVSTNGGDPVPIPVPFAYPQLLDFSIAHSELLVAGSTDDVTSRPLWSVPLPGGSTSFRQTDGPGRRVVAGRPRTCVYGGQSTLPFGRSRNGSSEARRAAGNGLAAALVARWEDPAIDHC